MGSNTLMTLEDLVKKNVILDQISDFVHFNRYKLVEKLFGILLFFPPIFVYMIGLIECCFFHKVFYMVLPLLLIPRFLNGFIYIIQIYYDSIIFQNMSLEMTYKGLVRHNKTTDNYVIINIYPVMTEEIDQPSNFYYLTNIIYIGENPIFELELHEPTKYYTMLHIHRIINVHFYLGLIRKKIIFFFLILW
jgi:hypothetical protein